MHESNIRVIDLPDEYKAFRAEVREGWYRELDKRHPLQDGRTHEYYRWRKRLPPTPEYPKGRRIGHPNRKTDPKWANEIVDVTEDVLEAV